MPKMPVKRTTNQVSSRIGLDVTHLGFGEQPGQLINLAKSLYNSGRYEHAIKALERALTQGFKSIELLNILGACHLCIKNYKLAENIYSEAISIDKNYSSGHGNLGIALYEQGRLEDALSAYKNALKLDPKNANFHTNIGNAFLKIGMPMDAIEHYEKALKLSPSNLIALSSLSKALIHVGNLDMAEITCQRSFEIDSRSPAVLNNLGHLSYEKGDLAAALAFYEQSLSVDLSNVDAIFGIGVIQFKQNNKELAVKSWYKVLQLDNSHSETYFNLGLHYQEIDDLNAAAKNYIRAIYNNKRHKKAFNNLAVVRYREQNFAEAEKLLRTSLSIDKNYVDAILTLISVLRASGKSGSALEFTSRMMLEKPSDQVISAHAMALKFNGRFDEAIDLMLSVAVKNPNDIDSRLELLKLYEGSNRVNELGILLCDLEKEGYGNSSIVRLFKAIHLIRLREYKDARELLVAFDSEYLAGEFKIQRYENLGLVEDKLNNISQAFSAYRKMNEATIQEHGSYSAEIELLFGDLDARKQDIQTYVRNRDRSFPFEDNSPRIGFVVGFPRSGTTLLDTILRSHSSITVIEEKPLLQHALYKVFGGTVPKIDDISDKQKMLLRKTYLERCEEHLGDEYKNGNLIIDKLPLNLSWLPYLDIMFPGAPIIFAARHPYDTILSNFMQNFALNSSMACMLNLNTAAELYVFCMDIFEASVKNLDLNVHLYRYESIVIDFDNEVSKLLAFLELDWEDEVRDYRKTAMARGKINTPSYKQVVQPIYSESAYRWERYKVFISEIFPQIEPYVEKLGYSDCGAEDTWDFANSFLNNKPLR